ncbi:MAG TPA: hypothetical protein VGX46_01665, partial [Vicinamibacterales bacterium]|nr:hypothetical protein [Vicinamibacterales bacterium]
MSRLVAGACRVYGAALTLIPRELRERYRDDMRQTFEDRAAACGPFALGALLVRELLDIAIARARAMPHALRPTTFQQRRHPVGSL